MARSDNVVSHYKIGILLSAVAAGYIVWGIVASPSKRLRQLTQSSSNQSNNESPTKSPLFGEELPRTDHAPFRYYAKNRDRIDDEGRVQKAPRAGVRVWSEEWRSLVVPVLVLVVALFWVFITMAKPRGLTFVVHW